MTIKRAGRWNPAPRVKSLLLGPGVEYRGRDGDDALAIGTGIIPIIGTARSAKTTLALALMEWVAEHTDRPLAFMGMPDAFMEALPEGIRSRGTNPPLFRLSHQRDSVCLLDDTAVSMNARDSATKRNKALNRIAGVLSHLGLTLILTTQSTATIDLALLRFTEMAPLVKRFDEMAMRVERTQWTESVKEAQEVLRRVRFDPAFYYSLADELLCRSPWPEWMRDNDVLSRPFRYLPQATLDRLISGNATAAEVEVE